MVHSIGANGWIWTSPFDDSSLTLIEHAGSMGFDSFEIPIEDPRTLSADKLKDAFQKSGLKPVAVGAFGPNRDLTHDDLAVRQESLAYMRASFELCEAMGARIFCGPSYSAVGKRRQVTVAQKKTEWQRAVQGLQEAGKMAADCGVILAVEPLNRFETDLINTCEQCRELIEEVACDAVRIHLDTFHMHIEERDTYQAVMAAGDRLAHIHASESDRGAPGSGQVNWGALAKALMKLNYTGEVVIESFTPNCKVIAEAAAIWRPLAESQDALAKDGLAFLRTLFSC